MLESDAGPEGAAPCSAAGRATIGIRRSVGQACGGVAAKVAGGAGLASSAARRMRSPAAGRPAVPAGRCSVSGRARPDADSVLAALGAATSSNPAPLGTRPPADGLVTIGTEDLGTVGVRIVGTGTGSVGSGTDTSRRSASERSASNVGDRNAGPKRWALSPPAPRPSARSAAATETRRHGHRRRRDRRDRQAWPWCGASAARISASRNPPIATCSATRLKPSGATLASSEVRSTPPPHDHIKRTHFLSNPKSPVTAQRSGFRCAPLRQAASVHQSLGFAPLQCPSACSIPRPRCSRSASRSSSA